MPGGCGNRPAATAFLAGLLIIGLFVSAAAAGSGPSAPERPITLSLSLRASPAGAGARAVPVAFTLAAPDAPKLGPKKRPGLAWIEMGAFLAYSTTSYWTRNAFPEDWQFRLNGHAQFDRIVLLDGWRFDSNNFKLNWTHSLAGAIYYQFARSNNLSWVNSWLMATAASTYWETIVEWREVISLNDQITTALGAFS